MIPIFCNTWAFNLPYSLGGNVRHDGWSGSYRATGGSNAVLDSTDGKPSSGEENRTRVRQGVFLGGWIMDLGNENTFYSVETKKVMLLEDAAVRNPGKQTL